MPSTYIYKEIDSCTSPSYRILLSIFFLFKLQIVCYARISMVRIGSHSTNHIGTQHGQFVLHFAVWLMNQ